MRASDTACSAATSRAPFPDVDSTYTPYTRPSWVHRSRTKVSANSLPLGASATGDRNIGSAHHGIGEAAGSATCSTTAETGSEGDGVAVGAFSPPLTQSRNPTMSVPATDGMRILVSRLPHSGHFGERSFPRGYHVCPQAPHVFCGRNVFAIPAPRPVNCRTMPESCREIEINRASIAYINYKERAPMVGPL